MSILDFFTPEAGQARRRALSRVDQKISDALGYYLGPQLAPRVEQAANIAGLLSPGQDVQDAYTASGELMAPNRSLLDRAASGAALAGAVGAMVMPGGVSSIRQGIDDLAEAGVRAYDPATTNAFTVWHGSPHDFDRFDMSKIGTGEGAQAYGHGLYFAENEAVARGYRDTLANRTSLGYFNPDFNAKDLLQRFGGDEEWAKEVLAESIQSADGPTRTQLEQTLESIATGSWKTADLPTGRLYEVSIDAEPEDFLDWDAPLSAQPERVRDALGQIGITDADAGAGAYMKAGTRRFSVQGADGRFGPGGATYEESLALAGGDPSRVRAIVDGSAPMRSEALREAGIPGIRYLDAGSRGAGDGSRNYVLFDDSLATIVGKDGQYTPAQQIARLLREGRGAEVTDELYAQADPQELSRLYKAGATGMDMPMGPAALERARAGGFDTATFRGMNAYTGGPTYRSSSQGMVLESDAPWREITEINAPGQYYLPSRMAGFSSDDPKVAARFQSWLEERGAVFPLMVNTDGMVDVDFAGLPAGSGQFDMFKDVGRSQRESILEAVADTQNNGVVMRNTGDEGTVFVPRHSQQYRSRFARFDPRLSHLRNLSAGLAGAGALGLGLLSMPPSQAEAEQYLAERGLLQ